MLTRSSLERRDVYLLLLIRWANIRINTRRKMEKEEKHWEVGNLYMTLSHKKDGKLWFSYIQYKSEIQMQNLLTIVFIRLTTIKLKSKKMCKKNHNNVVWFCTFQTLYITLCFCNFLTPHSIVSFYKSWTL
jgi:hypothetical protein